MANAQFILLRSAMARDKIYSLLMEVFLRKSEEHNKHQLGVVVECTAKTWYDIRY